MRKTMKDCWLPLAGVKDEIDVKTDFWWTKGRPLGEVLKHKTFWGRFHIFCPGGPWGANHLSLPRELLNSHVHWKYVSYNYKIERKLQRIFLYSPSQTDSSKDHWTQLFTLSFKIFREIVYGLYIILSFFLWVTVVLVVCPKLLARTMQLT